MDADLTVSNPTVVSLPATYENPAQHPKGIPHVVNGKFVVRDGETTGNTPGEALRA